MNHRKITTLKETLHNWYERRYGVQPLSESHNALSLWFKRQFGQSILDEQKKCLNAVLSEIYGYHLMELSVLQQQQFSGASAISHQFSLTPFKTETAKAYASFEYLPIDEEVIDACILHHCLEYSPKPHQCLREACRSVIPNGYIIIIGFNPISILQLKKWLGRYLLAKPQWRYHFLLRHRIEDWLRVLDFEVVYKKNAGFNLPTDHTTPHRLRIFLRFFSPVSANFYVLVARKTKTPMTMIKPWKKKNRLSHWVKQPAVSRGSMQSTNKEGINENR